jgi:TrmH family RNA methyltransferase
VPFDAVDWRGPIACFVGGEGAACRGAAGDGRSRVRIPMAEPVESLNVAVSAGVLLYEAWRQRTRPARDYVRLMTTIRRLVISSTA